MPPQRSKTVEALIVGAERAFAERGFHGASIGYICQCAGRTTGAFYSNYDSKLKLFLDVFRRHSDRTADYIGERIDEMDTGRDLAPSSPGPSPRSSTVSTWTPAGSSSTSNSG
ncbi:hypothetical protein SVIO_013150 [Streptomyces violaceusniger]|uniref:HTH tetR-type domain-containing protein n=1 Tax=Streptomyces violaceusniger TaxID=68280 RepID=A0A4D4KPZ1_STRVO|nr:hypothetical protein SVIO_013150 [Streptomyces violaceusniger]